MARSNARQREAPKTETCAPSSPQKNIFPLNAHFLGASFLVTRRFL